ncbi:hypothetical protein NC652_015262 [Populus alba x Populus x berolinensis]|nr:hypothetical protein NC652_015262 [Populus alba x Populus x berolinensis]
MARKETLLVSFTCLLVVASVAMCANATAAPRLLASEQVVAAASLSERHQTYAVDIHAALTLQERTVASENNKTMRRGRGSMYTVTPTRNLQSPTDGSGNVTIESPSKLVDEWVQSSNKVVC